jgi:hypothetical protein
MSHLAYHLLIRLAVYPAFYWIGFALVKGLTLGSAIIMPYSDLGDEEDAAWWEFRIRRWGYKEWRPESMIIFGGCAVLFAVSSYYLCRHLL